MKMRIRGGTFKRSAALVLPSCKALNGGLLGGLRPAITSKRAGSVTGCSSCQVLDKTPVKLDPPDTPDFCAPHMQHHRAL